MKIRPKMPFFWNMFSPKKTPPRKSASLSNLHSLDRSTRELELGLEYGSPTMNLAGQSLKFENGQWIAETGVSGGVDRREVQRLRRRNQQLEEENNLLRLKVDILLDMTSGFGPGREYPIMGLTGTGTLGLAIKGDTEWRRPRFHMGAVMRRRFTCTVCGCQSENQTAWRSGSADELLGTLHAHKLANTHVPE
ncbi:protein chibby homolog 1 isoform X2 [Callithrix jacchus]